MDAREELPGGWGSFWHFACAGSVVVCAAVALFDHGRAELVIGASSVMVVANWLFVLRRRANQERRALMSGYLIGATALACAASFVHPVFLTATGCLAAQVFTLLPLKWAIPHAALLGASIAVRMLMLGSVTGAFMVLVSSVIGVFIAAFITAILRRSEERARLIAELEATRRDLAAAEREAGTTLERQRVSHEIHDTLTQDLIGLVRILEGRADDPALAAAKEALAQSRRLVTTLRPPLLEEGGSLGEALRTVVDRFAAENGLAADLSIDDVAALPLPVEVALLRAAQEALQNVAKHAGAKSVSVTLSRVGNVLLLDVQDDGRGFDPAKAAPELRSDGGFGLIAMRERVSSVGGVVEVESAPGEGTTVSVHIPFGGEVA